MTGSRPPTSFESSCKHLADSFQRLKAECEYLRTQLTLSIASQLTLRCFIPESQVSFFSGHALTVCNPGGFLAPSIPPPPKAPSSLSPPYSRETLFDGLCLYLNLASFSEYLRMFSYVNFYSPVPHCYLHARRQA